jgi:hypothetical protein
MLQTQMFETMTQAAGPAVGTSTGAKMPFWLVKATWIEDESDARTGAKTLMFVKDERRRDYLTVQTRDKCMGPASEHTSFL